MPVIFPLTRRIADEYVVLTQQYSIVSGTVQLQMCSNRSEHQEDFLTPLPTSLKQALIHLWFFSAGEDLDCLNTKLLWRPIPLLPVSVYQGLAPLAASYGCLQLSTHPVGWQTITWVCHSSEAGEGLPDHHWSSWELRKLQLWLLLQLKQVISFYLRHGNPKQKTNNNYLIVTKGWVFPCFYTCEMQRLSFLCKFTLSRNTFIQKDSSDILQQTILNCFKYFDNSCLENVYNLTHIS